MTTATPDRSEAEASSTVLRDVLASAVTFAVALPLCIGIAVACGVPAERGLVTGIIGGIVVGILSGAPLLVSGPAASLIVPVFDVVHAHGLEALGPIIVLAGVWQMLAGLLRLGQWFRAVAPAVIVGMLIGIGVLIFASQLHVAIGGDPKGTFLENVLDFFPALLETERRAALAGSTSLGIATIVILVGWNRFRPSRLHLVPGHLVALTAVTLAAVVFDIPVRNLDIASRFFDNITPLRLSSFSMLWTEKSFIGLSVVFAFVASAATLLTASAIDQRQNFSRADYDREMFAQGVGNLLAGGVGGLPMTGVIVRSSVNVDAGARTRLSTILHGVWILAFVAIAPEILERIPRSALGAILVYTGFRLIDVNGLKELYRRSRGELVIALLTLFGVVFIELFVGILLGLGAAVAKLVFTFTRLDIRSDGAPDDNVHHLYLTGAATFVQLPRLAKALEAVPPHRALHLHIEGLAHIDHACLELLSNWERRQEGNEGSGLVVEWDELTSRYRHARLGGQDGRSDTGSLLGDLWSDWKRAYGALARVASTSRVGSEWIDASRIRLQVDARSLDDVLGIAVDTLAPAAGIDAARLRAALQDRAKAASVTLGHGVSLPHAPIAGIDRPLAAIVTTRQPVPLAGETADLFFVMLAPQDDPRRHLVALAHVARICHEPAVLAGLRAATSPDVALRLVEHVDGPPSAPAAATSMTPTGTQALVVLEVEQHAAVLRDLVFEAFGPAAMLSERDGAVFDAFARALSASRTNRLLVLSLTDSQQRLLPPLLAEFSSLVGPGLARARFLSPEPQFDPEDATGAAPDG